MGGILSINQVKPTESFHAPRKRRKASSSSSFWNNNPLLIPGLPDEISLQILARVPRIWYLNLKAVSRIWRSSVTSPEIYKIRKELGTTEDWLYISTKGRDSNPPLWHALDPVSKKWLKLPPIPIEDSSGSGISDVVRGWLGLKVHVNRTLFSGCAVAAIDGCLYMLGGFSKDSSSTRVWKYDPVLNSWSEANPMCVGRACFEAAVLNGKMYVVGGIGRHPDGCTMLESAEVFDPQTGLWSEIPSMPFSKARAAPAAVLEHLPGNVATGLACYRGKLYVPQSLFFYPGFFGAGGEVYDPETNSWDDMPWGMGYGWSAMLAGFKTSAVVDGDLYTLDPSESVKVKVYDCWDDSWKVVTGDVPIHAESSSLLSGLLGKLHVVTKDGNRMDVLRRSDKQIAALDEGSCESDMWNVIASRDFGICNLEGCQNLDL